MRMARLHALPALDIPLVEHTVTTPADQHRAGRTPRQRIHDLAQLAQDVEVSCISDQGTIMARPSI